MSFSVYSALCLQTFQNLQNVIKHANSNTRSKNRATLQRVLGKTDIQRHNTYVLDQSGYIVFSNRARTVGTFIGQVEPCALDLMEKSGEFVTCSWLFIRVQFEIFPDYSIRTLESHFRKFENR